MFEGADADVTYTIKVTLVLNGKTIADSQKTLKAVAKDNNNTKPLGITQELDITLNSPRDLLSRDTSLESSQQTST